MAFSSLNSQLDNAVKEGKVPQAVVFAASRDGSFSYSYATGKASLEDGAADIKDDAVFLLASQTKLLTAVAALQIVEKGLIALDDGVEEIVPELAEQKVLTGFNEDGEPVLEARTKPITFRALLTHTAGTAYDAGHPLLLKYQSHLNLTPNTGPDVISRFSYPLIFQPGTAWCYGSGIDWAGLVIERLTKSTLEEYMKAHIWEPLGLKTMTFFPSRKEGLEERVPVLSVRGSDGKLYPFKEPFLNTGATGCFGGSGGYSTLGEYRIFLLSLLRNDSTLLPPSSIDLLFTPQLTPPQAASFKAFLLGPMGAFFIGEFLPEKHVHDFGFGGVVFVEAYSDGRRKAGALSWGGVANTFWMIDREAGLAVTFGTQVIPPGDKGVQGVITGVEKEVYKMVEGVA